MQTLNVDDREIRAFTAKLETMHRAAFPNAVRDTLNDLAFDVRGIAGAKGLLQESAEANFKHTRARNFIKNLSGVTRAKGFDMDKMSAEVGIRRNAKGRGHVAENLAVQEKGGTLPQKREFIPMDQARSGRNKSKSVAPRNRLNRLPKNIRTIQGRGNKQGLAIAAKQGERYVIYQKNYTTLFEIKSASPLHLIPIYRYDEGFKPRVGRHSFVEPAGKKAMVKMNKAYKKNAERQIQKFKNR